MMYPYVLVKARFRGHTDLYLLNPITEAVLSFQRAFWVGATHNPAHTATTDMPPDLLWLSIRALLLCLVVLAVAQVTFSRLERRIPERLL
jgi:ABC-2 type transport system permease protein